ncbi:MAG: 30S ribosomal protein S27ae [Thermococcus sp.]|nr:30S ribosomal protein S27ae [Thermococcus sp.]
MAKGKKKTSQKWKLYEVKDGKVIRKNKFCPRCGPGVFMADHGDRWACGRCGYTEWKK